MAATTRLVRALQTLITELQAALPTASATTDCWLEPLPQDVTRALADAHAVIHDDPTIEAVLVSWATAIQRLTGRDTEFGKTFPRARHKLRRHRLPLTMRVEVLQLIDDLKRGTGGRQKTLRELARDVLDRSAGIPCDGANLLVLSDTADRGMLRKLNVPELIECVEALLSEATTAPGVPSPDKLERKVPPKSDDREKARKPGRQPKVDSGLEPNAEKAILDEWESWDGKGRRKGFHKQCHPEMTFEAMNAAIEHAQERRRARNRKP